MENRDDISFNRKEFTLCSTKQKTTHVFSAWFPDLLLVHVHD